MMVGGLLNADISVKVSQPDEDEETTVNKDQDRDLDVDEPHKKKQKVDKSDSVSSDSDSEKDENSEKGEEKVSKQKENDIMQRKKVFFQRQGTNVFTSLFTLSKENNKSGKTSRYNSFTLLI